MMRPVLGPMFLVLVVAGCEGPAAPRPFSATYRFDGVRSDEWAPIQQILQKHSTTTPVEERRRRANLGTSDVSDYRATVTFPRMATADQVHAEIEALRSGDKRIEFGLIGTEIAYRGNTVAAGVTLHISGFATEGYRVRLFPSETADPIELTAGRNGLWSARLGAAPSDGWVYGISEDRSGRVRPRCFRVNVATQKQELVDEAEFWKRFPQWKPAAEPPPAGKKDK